MEKSSINCSDLLAERCYDFGMKSAGSHVAFYFDLFFFFFYPSEDLIYFPRCLVGWKDSMVGGGGEGGRWRWGGGG